MPCLALFALFRSALPTVNTPRFLFSRSSPSFVPLYIHAHIQCNTHARECTRSVAAYIRICTPACTWILCKRNVQRVKRRGKLHTEEAPTHALLPTDRRNPLHFVSTLYADHSASLSSLGSFLLLPPFLAFYFSIRKFARCLSGRASRAAAFPSLPLPDTANHLRRFVREACTIGS